MQIFRIMWQRPAFILSALLLYSIVKNTAANQGVIMRCLFYLIIVSSYLTVPPTWGVGLIVEEAPEWNALFDRTQGWTGADGIYSIPLSGNESPGNSDTTYTAWVFGDTFIGTVDSEGKREQGTALINNTVALMYGVLPEPSNISFYWKQTPEGDPEAVFVPDTANAEPEHWYWLQDGAVIGDSFYLFPVRMKPLNNFFAVDGVAMIRSPIQKHHPLSVATQVETPFFYKPDDGRGEIYFGAGLMVNTDGAGSPSPDGYVYIYGTQNDPLIKKLVVARVVPGDIEKFDAWRFWNGSDWVAGIEESAPVTDRVSSELSVTPIGEGRYVLVFQVDTIGPDVGIRIGDSPVGPWGAIQRIYTAPEAALDPDIYTYNAKAHPHLSQKDELLISYNVNTLNFLDHFRYADIYRPRFIRLIVE